MNPAEWQKIKGIFNAAIDLPENERAAFLDKHDEITIQKVKNLLKANENANDFIAESAFVDVGLVDENETDFYVGKQIDDYKILEELGHGGMGTVYLALRSDETFDKKVAIKLIKRGMDTSAVLKRFVMERKILAQLENPNIASLLDGGSTADGLPYLVMEYIEGEPITKFCDSRDLSIEERLELFRKVCSAISYAHQNLVVHRDIKPSNILITKDGTPKLLDFGIAKLLHPDWSLDTNEATATMFRLMTPEYASPEQIRGLPITTTSDVYSLGVVLYELLSGERPYKIESRLPQEIANVILTEEPIKPSLISNFKFQIPNSKSKSETNPNDEQTTTDDLQINNPKSQIPNPKFLKGDLDNIILKALRKEPERRYQSVQEFSEDIRRHLIGLPVTATADTTFYRVGKFIKRHRGGVFAASLIFLILLTATAITSWQTIVAKRERTRAEQRFNQVRKLANTILFDYHERIKNLPGATETRKKLVTDALEYLDNLAQNSDDSPELQRELALAYQKVGDIQGGISESANTGESDAALENYRKALAIQEKLVSRFPESDADRTTLAKLYINVGGEIGKAVEILNEISQKDLQNAPAQANLAKALFSLATAIRAKGDFDGAILNYRQAGEIYEKLALESKDAEKRGTNLRNAALTYKTTGAVFEQKQDSVSALELYRKALEIDTKNAADNPNNVQYQLDSAFTYNSIASVLPDFNNFDEARENCQKALAIQEKVVADDPQNSFAKYAVARTFRRMGDLLQSLEKFDEADEHYRKAIQKLEELVQSNPNDDGQKARLAELYSVFGEFLYKSALRNDSQKHSGLREAQTFQKRGLEMFTNLQSQNKLTKASEKILTEAQSNLQKTEDELAKLSIK